MAKVLYTAQALVGVGRDRGHGVASDQAVDVQFSTSIEMGSKDGRADPGQRLSAGDAAGFEGAVGGVGRQKQVELGVVSIDSEASVTTPKDGNLPWSIVPS